MTLAGRLPVVPTRRVVLSTGTRGVEGEGEGWVSGPRGCRVGGEGPTSLPTWLDEGGDQRYCDVKGCRGPNTVE